MAFGKFRDGVNAQGQSMANWANGDQADFLTRRRVGVLTRKSGEFINVFMEKAQDLGGYYSLGMVGPVTDDLATWNLADTFLNGADRLTTFKRLAAMPQFNGRGGVGPAYDMLERSPLFQEWDQKIGVSELDYFTVSGPAAAHPRFDSSGSGDTRCQEYNFHFYAGPTSQEIVLRYTINPVYQFEFPYYAYTRAHPSVREVGGTPVWWSSVSFTYLDGAGQIIPGVVHDDGTNLTVGTVLRHVNQIPGKSEVYKLAPDALLKLDHYLRPWQESGGASITTSPGWVLSFAWDAGASWGYVGGNFLTSENAGLTGIAGDTAPGSGPGYQSYYGNAQLFNAVVMNMGLAVAPVSRSEAIVLGTIPYFDGTSWKTRAKLGRLTRSASSCAIDTTLTLSSDAGAPADIHVADAPTSGGYTPLELLPVPGGALLVSTLAADPWPALAHPLIQFTDGYTLTDIARMPFEAYRTGPLFQFSSTQIGSVMWVDGLAILHLSSDNGATWKEACVVADPADDPIRQLIPNTIAGTAYYKSTGPVFMVDWGQFLITNREGAWANPFPQTPWLLDGRVADS